MKHNGQQLHKEESDMSNRRAPNAANARFIEIGSSGEPFRTLVNVDHLTNVRYEQKFSEDGALEGWAVVLIFGQNGQNIAFVDERSSINCYNSILDMIQGTGAPIMRIPKLRPQPEIENTTSKLVTPEGAPLTPAAPVEEAVADAIEEALDPASADLPEQK